MSEYRHELKCICKESELRIVENSLQRILKRDNHADSNGEYYVSSIYFDSLSRKCYYENENGIQPRHKFRLRTYNHSDSHISLEKKSKLYGMTSKRQFEINKETCQRMIAGASLLDYLGMNSVMDEWILEKNRDLLRASVLIEYIRTPYVYKNGNVRVTFDRFISASYNMDGLFSSEISKTAVLPKGFHILEIKYCL